MDYLLVFVTIPGRLAAVEVVRALLDARCIAGANIIPGTVTWYRDDVGLHETRESLLFCRTLPAQVERMRATLREQVGDDDFEISSIPIEAGNLAYSAWVRRVVE
jgi:periplasmic divalent cation tolerance protein